MKIHLVISACLLLMTLSFCQQKKQSEKSTIDMKESTQSVSKGYIGTYTRKEGHVDGKAKGIYFLDLDSKKNQPSKPKLVAEIINPSFLKLSKDNKNLYAVSELAHENEPSGLIYSFKVNPDHTLSPINILSTGTKAPCHISIDHEGQFVFVANYLGGMVMMYQRLPNGSLQSIDSIVLKGTGPHPEQESSHPHSVHIAMNGKLIMIPDKGSDKIWKFEVQRNQKTLTPSAQPFISLNPGSGPRHMVFDAEENYAYVINELNGTITVLENDKVNNSLSVIQTTSTLPKDYEGANSCADIHLHPSGKFLYGSNRGHNSIAAYQINELGKLNLIGITSTNGDAPRNFAIDNSGSFLYIANQNSDNITTFSIDQTTGAVLTEKSEIGILSPVCIEIME